MHLSNFINVSLDQLGPSEPSKSGLLCACATGRDRASSGLSGAAVPRCRGASGSPSLRIQRLSISGPALVPGITLWIWTIIDDDLRGLMTYDYSLSCLIKLSFFMISFLLCGIWKIHKYDASAKVLDLQMFGNSATTKQSAFHKGSAATTDFEVASMTSPQSLKQALISSTATDRSYSNAWIIQSPPNSLEIDLLTGLESTWVPDPKGPNGGLTYGKWCHFGFQIEKIQCIAWYVCQLLGGFGSFPVLWNP